MAVNLVCPMCSRSVSIPPDHGQTCINCPGCGYPIVVETDVVGEAEMPKAGVDQSVFHGLWSRIPGGAYRWYIVGGLALAVLVLGPTIGWIALLRIGFLALSVLAASATVLFAWKAWGSPARSDDQYGYGTLTTMAAIGLLGCLLVYQRLGVREDASIASSEQEPPGKSVSRQAVATWEYWQRLKQIDDTFDRFDSGEPPSTLVGIKAHLEDMLTVVDQAKKELLVLPVKDVDHEVTDIGSRFFELHGEGAITANSLKAVVEEAEQFCQEAGSDAAMVEAFFRGYLGDPFGKSNEVRAEGQRIKAKYDYVLSQIEELVRHSNKLDAEANRLRAELTRRYGREFPPFD